MGKRRSIWKKFSTESSNNANETAQKKDPLELVGNDNVHKISSEKDDTLKKQNSLGNYTTIDGNKQYRNDRSNRERSGRGNNYESNDKQRLVGLNECSSSQNQKLLNTASFKRDGYDEYAGSQHIDVGTRNIKVERENTPRNYDNGKSVEHSGQYNYDQQHSEIPTRENTSYKHKNHSLKSSSFNNGNFKKGMEREKDGNTRNSDRQIHNPENRSFQRSNNPEKKSYRTDERRRSYTSDIEGERKNYGKHNYHQNVYRRSSNLHHEERRRKDTPRKYSNEKEVEPLGYLSENLENQTPIPDTHTLQIEDSTPANTYSWDVLNISTSIPDAQGTTSSYHDDSYISNPVPTNPVPLVSPGSSKLNPNAESFDFMNEKPKWIDMFEESEAHIAEDGNISNELQALRNNTKSTTNSTGDNINSLPSIKVKEHNETGTIRKKSENESNWRTKEKPDKKKRGKNNLSSAASQSKQQTTIDQWISTTEDNNYSAVVSIGSNVSQNSEISLDETQSEHWSQQGDYNDSYDNKKMKSRLSDGRSNRDSSFEDRSKYRPPSRKSLNMFFENSAFKDDNEWAEFKVYVESAKAEHFVKVTEQEKDLFSVGEDYSLAHCVAEDMNMGSGIAVEFRRKFKCVPELLAMRQRSGGLAVLEVNGRYIYYMVTKKVSSGKPTYESFWKSLKKLRNHVKKNEVKKLAIPRIGCGLDRLNWNIVKIMVEFLFQTLDVSILVCNFQQEESFSSPSVQRSKKCRIVYENYPITDIDQGTIIIYFASVDGEPTPCMMELDKKFNFLSAFKRERKNLGDAIRFEDRAKNYILYGCIVKKIKNDLFDFISFGKCLSVIQKMNRKDGFVYVGFQRLEDDRDDILNEKVLNIITHSLKDVDIYCCNSDFSLSNSQKGG